MALKTKYSPLQHFSLENIYNTFIGLAPREKIIALAGIGLLLMIILLLPFSLVSGKLRSMQRDIETLEQGHKDVQNKIAEWKAVSAEIQGLEKKFGGGGPSGSVTSLVENEAKKIGVTVDQLKEKPAQDTDFLTLNAVELRLSGASLQQIVQFLYEIEHDPTRLMRARHVQLKPKSANRQLMDFSCEVMTYSFRKES